MKEAALRQMSKSKCATFITPTLRLKHSLGGLQFNYAGYTLPLSLRVGCSVYQPQNDGTQNKLKVIEPRS